MVDLTKKIEEIPKKAIDEMLVNIINYANNRLTLQIPRIDSSSYYTTIKAEYLEFIPKEWIFSADSTRLLKKRNNFLYLTKKGYKSIREYLSTKLSRADMINIDNFAEKFYAKVEERTNKKIDFYEKNIQFLKEEIKRVLE